MKKLTLLAFLLLVLFGCSKENQTVVEDYKPNDFSFATDNDILESFGLYTFFVEKNGKEIEVAAICLASQSLIDCFELFEDYEYIGRQDVYSYDCEVRGNYHVFIKKTKN